MNQPRLLRNKQESPTVGHDHVHMVTAPSTVLSLSWQCRPADFIHVGQMRGAPPHRPTPRSPPGWPGVAPPSPWRAQSVGPEHEAAAASLARDYFQWTSNAPVGLHHMPGASMMVTTACAFLCPLYALEEPPRREGREGLDAPDTPPQRRDPVQ